MQEVNVAPLVDQHLPHAAKKVTPRLLSPRAQDGSLNFTNTSCRSRSDNALPIATIRIPILNTYQVAQIDRSKAYENYPAHFESYSAPRQIITPPPPHAPHHVHLTRTFRCRRRNQVSRANRLSLLSRVVSTSIPGSLSTPRFCPSFPSLIYH